MKRPVPSDEEIAIYYQSRSGDFAVLVDALGSHEELRFLGREMALPQACLSESEFRRLACMMDDLGVNSASIVRSGNALEIEFTLSRYKTWMTGNDKELHLLYSNAGDGGPTEEALVDAGFGIRRNVVVRRISESWYLCEITRRYAD